MKKLQPFILIILCACGVWADEVLELKPRLAEVAGAQGPAYVKLRDQLVADESTNVLFLAVNDERLDWREHLVARIALERMLRGADIQSLRRYDWPKDPDFNPAWLKHHAGFAGQMRPMADKRIHAAGLWYYYLETIWKDMQETTHKRFGKQLADAWPSYLLRAVSQVPEGGYRHRVMMDRLVADPPPDRYLFVRFYSTLIEDRCSDAVPVLLQQYKRYLEMHYGKITEPLVWSAEQSYQYSFRRIIAIADVRHDPYFNETLDKYNWLEACREQVSAIQQRPAPKTVDSEPPFRLMSTPDFLKTGPFAEDVVDPYMRRDR
jgi:hypothetical protein